MNAKKNRNDDGDGEFEIEVRASSMISVNKVQLNQYNVHLDEDIVDPAKYRDLITLLFNASENDMVTIYINCGGGYLDSAMAIIEGLKITKAHARCIILGKCHSAASMISMYAHEIIVLDAAHSLVHTATFGSSGNTNNIKTHTDFTVKQIEKFIHATYNGFLTETELTNVKSGVELWLDADQLRERMVKRNKFIEAEDKKLEAMEAKKAKVKPKPKPKETK